MTLALPRTRSPSHLHPGIRAEKSHSHPPTEVVGLTESKVHLLQGRRMKVQGAVGVGVFSGSTPTLDCGEMLCHWARVASLQGRPQRAAERLPEGQVNHSRARSSLPARPLHQYPRLKARCQKRSDLTGEGVTLMASTHSLLLSIAQIHRSKDLPPGQHKQCALQGIFFCGQVKQPKIREEKR